MDETVIYFSAASIALIHTLVGPDHYLPFVMIARARKWSVGYMVLITGLCGAGHILGSSVLGLMGIGLGYSSSMIGIIETTRADFAAWMLFGFGIAYAAWGLRMVIRNKNHVHVHQHVGLEHRHTHSHDTSHSHIHGNVRSMTPWMLFIIFILGPCEPLIPLFIYPAATGGLMDVVLVILIFGAVTIITMTASVYLLYKGILTIDFGWLNRYMHPIAGSTIAASGLLILVFNL